MREPATEATEPDQRTDSEEDPDVGPFHDPNSEEGEAEA
jgi:hypothetical protein